VRFLSILILFFLTIFSGYNLSKAEPYIFLIRKGNSYYIKEHYQEALSFFKKAQQKRDKELLPLFNSGAALYRMEDYVGAVEAFTKVLQEEDTELKQKTYYNLGNSYYRLGEYERAAESYIKALELDPHDFDAKHNLEMALKKIAENNEKPQKDEMKGAKPEERTRGDGKISPEKQEQTKKPVAGDTITPEDLLSPDKAKSLINSLNTDQTSIIKDIIQNKIGKVENEKDW